MNKRISLENIFFLCFSLLVIVSILIGILEKGRSSLKNEASMRVIYTDNEKVTLETPNNEIYTVKIPKHDLKSGDFLLLEYTGVLDSKKDLQDIKVTNYTKEVMKTDNNGIPVDWLDDGIFKEYYIMAYNKLKTLTLDEKIGQVLLVRYIDNAVSILKDYPVSGFVFFEKDFKDKTKNEVVKMTYSLKNRTTIPLLTAVDEEGGNIVRISSNPNLRSSKFKSPSELYKEGGFDLIKDDTIEKSKLLKSLGLNLNLAPDVDVATDEDAYIYPRTLQENTDLTSKYAEVVIKNSKGTGVSYTLKHFPGYSNNLDTHAGASLDNRSLNDILTNDIPPFEAGIKAGAEAVLVSHNVIPSIEDMPASLSNQVHSMLRSDLKFTGVVISDDIAMSALTAISNTTLKALISGNDLIITTDYETSFRELKTSIADNTLDESILDHHVFRILAWKYYKNMIATK